MKTKRHYTSPVTQRATVELEGGFCSSLEGSVIDNDGKSATVISTPQDYKEFDANVWGETDNSSVISW